MQYISISYFLLYAFVKKGIGDFGPNSKILGEELEFIIKKVLF
jgi:hypothetical protein